jgi:S1-C subfamily serine protease
MNLLLSRIVVVCGRMKTKLVSQSSLAILLLVVNLTATAQSQTAASPTGSEGINSDAVANSVVKVFSTMRYPDYYRPWTRQSSSEETGSGVVIEGNRILTCAHVVMYASQVQVQANQAGDKVSATVEAIAPGIDLAVLKVDDKTFFDSHPALPRAKNLPDIEDAVMTYGYPEGGNTLSITKGIVSRIEFTSYNFPVSGLRIQVDAAINPGNSGGPAVVDGKMIGLAFSYLGKAQNIGYIIPDEEIELFLQDIADGHYDGKPAMFDDLQTLENPALRSFLKLDEPIKGIVVHKPAGNDPGYPLKEWDVITKIGDTPVDDQGMIKLNDSLRIRFAYLIQKIAKNGKVPLTVARAGKEIQIELPVMPKIEMVIPDAEGSYPSYFIYGPLVFSSATRQFVEDLIRSEYGSRWESELIRTSNPLLKRWSDKSAFKGEHLVVISSPFFPHKLSEGYSNPFTIVVKTVNGIPIKNLGHLVQVLRDSKNEFIAIEPDASDGETMVFPRAEMLAATDEILTDNGVRSQGSPDTMAIWNEKSSQ